MKSDSKKWSTVLGTGLLLTASAMQLDANDNPFSASVFRTTQYQIADLDEEGCGGAMTEYRVTREESPADKEESVASDDEADTEATSLWGKWCRQLGITADD